MISSQKFQALKDLVSEGNEIPMVKTSESFAIQVINLLDISSKAVIVHRLIRGLIHTQDDLKRLIELWRWRNQIHSALCILRREKGKSAANLLPENVTAL